MKTARPTTQERRAQRRREKRLALQLAEARWHEAERALRLTGGRLSSIGIVLEVLQSELVKFEQEMTASPLRDALVADEGLSRVPRRLRRNVRSFLRVVQRLQGSENHVAADLSEQLEQHRLARRGSDKGNLAR